MRPCEGDLISEVRAEVTYWVAVCVDVDKAHQNGGDRIGYRLWSRA